MSGKNSRILDIRSEFMRQKR